MAIPMTHGMVWYDHSSTVVMCISWNCAGTKNVAKEMRKICAGTVRNRDKTWFSELSDKGECVVIWKYKFTAFCHLARTTNVHLYWCMRNCDGDPDRLRAMIMNISKHFQVCACL